MARTASPGVAEAEEIIRHNEEELRHAWTHAISAAEVTHASPHGFWLLLDDEELLVAFSEFPWFRDATIGQLTAVEWPTPEHLYWPELDVDLSVSSVRNPGASEVGALGRDATKAFVENALRPARPHNPGVRDAE